MAEEGAKLATGWLELVVSAQGAEQQITESIAPGAAKAGESAGSSIGGMLLGGLKKFAGPIALIAAGFSAKKVADDSTEAFEGLASSTKGLQRLTGGTAAQASGLSASLALSGVTSDKASVALKAFSNNLGKASAAGADASGVASELGVSFQDAAGNVLPMSQILPGLADKFQAMPDGAEKTALAMQLFGKQGTAMIPFLNKGSAGIADLTSKATEMGLVLDDTSMNIFSKSVVSSRNFTESVLGMQSALGQDLLPVIDAVQNVGRAFLMPMIQGLTTLFLGARSPILSLADGIDGFSVRAEAAGGAIIGFFETAGTRVVNAVKYIVGYVSGSGSQADVGSWEKPLETISTIIIAVQSAFSGLAPVIGGLLPQLLQLYTAISPTSIVFQALLPVLPTLMQLVTTLGTAIGGLLTTALTQVLPAILQLATTLGGLLTTGVQLLLPIVVQLATTLAGLLSGAVTTIVPVVVQLATILAGVLSGAITSLMPIITQIATVLGQVLGSALTALSPILTIVAQVFGQVLNAVMPLLAPILGLITPILGLVAPLLQLISPILTLVGQLLTPLIGLLVQLLTPILGLITPLVGLLVPVLQFVVTILTYVVEAIVNVITWLVDLVTGSGDAGAQLATIWNQTMGMFSDFFTNTVGMFVDFFNNTIGMISDFGSNLVLGFQIMWSTATSAVSDGVNNVISFITGLPGQALTALGDLGSLLIDSGRALIQGFIDGITGMLGGVGDAVGGVMDFVGSFFPHSPARRGPLSGSGWAAIGTSGLAIGNHFAGGLSRSKTPISAAMGTLLAVPSARALSGALSGDAASAGTNGSGGNGGPLVAVYPAAGQSEETIGRVVGNTINQKLRK